MTVSIFNTKLFIAHDHTYNFFLSPNRLIYQREKITQIHMVEDYDLETIWYIIIVIKVKYGFTTQFYGFTDEFWLGTGKKIQ